MKRFVLATLALALFAGAASADGRRLVRQRVVSRGAVALGVARAVGFGLGFRSPLGFGYGFGHAAFVQPFVAATGIVQPVQALTTVQAVAPVVQAQAVVGDCCQTQA